MVFKNYEYFLMIVEEGSISKAADRLYISQPSLSKYLKRLEQNIGTTLFFRDSYPLRLTDSGNLYLSHVKDIVQKEKGLIQEFSELSNIESGLVSVGITVWRSSILLPIALPYFKQLYPRIEIKVYEGSHQYMASLLEQGKVDFSIFHLPNNHQNVTFEHMQYEKILFCVNIEHPLLKRLGKEQAHVVSHMDHDEFMHFHAEPYILLKPGQNLRDIAQHFLNRLGISPHIALETSNIVTAMNMAKAGFGVTFIPEAALHIAEHTQGLAFFTVDIPPLQWEVGFGYQTKTIPGRQARLFMEHIRSCVNKTAL